MCIKTYRENFTNSSRYRFSLILDNKLRGGISSVKEDRYVDSDENKKIL